MKLVRQDLVGNTFLHPAIDYIAIGSAWSILITGYWLWRPSMVAEVGTSVWVWSMLLVNSAHFAASTVRLYSRPGYYKDFPFISFGLPAVTFAGLALCVMFPGDAGYYLQVVYLTWAPFHYAKQVYGLSLMYGFRSGIRFDDGDKRMIYWVSMLPFIYAFFGGSPHMGAGWLLPPEVVRNVPGLLVALTAVKNILQIAVFVAPLLMYWKIAATKRRGLPLIILLMMLSNGLWWVALNFNEAFVLATIGHGVQYMAITLIYHVREQARRPDNRHGWTYHALSFYAKCVALGYALFNCWPYFFVWAGAGVAESMLLVIATINVHHFIVDAYIWRLRVPANRTALEDRVVSI
jgi:hypothetical protein